MIKGLDIRDLGMRLNSSYIRYKGRVCYVGEVYVGEDGKKRIHMHRVNDHYAHRILLSSPNIDLSPIPLGYINLEGGAVYLSRVPARQWKQGLQDKHLKCNGPQRVRLFQSRSRVQDMVDNVYPSFREASAADGITAFTRTLAVDGTSILYKGNRVGIIENGVNFVAEGRYGFLAKQIEEEIRGAE